MTAAPSLLLRLAWATVILCAVALVLPLPVATANAVMGVSQLAPQPVATVAQKSKKKRKSKKKKRKKRGVRKKILSSEAGTKKGQSTKIDFDEASIDGRRRAPMGVAINKNKGDDEYDLIKLRLKWHQEMVDSAANLETGKNR